jgi:hypothetical protein
MEWLIGLTGGLVAGGILLFVEYVLRKHEQKDAIAEERIIKFTNEERRITRSIFTYLGPGSSVELMKSDLGPPNKKLKAQVGLFATDVDDQPEDTNIYIYFFKNAHVKLTSLDGQTIDSITVAAHETDIAFNNLFFVNPDEKDDFLNVGKFTSEMLLGSKAEQFQGCNDCFSAVQTFVNSPFRIFQTYFCNYSGNGDITKNPEFLVGTVIDGICLSSRPDNASYILTSDIL